MTSVREKYSYLKDLYLKKHWSEFGFQVHKSEMAQLLREEKQTYSRKTIDDIQISDIFSLRALHNLPKSLPLFDIIKIIQLKLMHSDLTIISDYNEFIKLPQYKEFQALHNLNIDLGNIEHLIKLQVSDPYKESSLPMQ